jgi:hypothetical protein
VTFTHILTVVTWLYGYPAGLGPVYTFTEFPDEATCLHARDRLIQEMKNWPLDKLPYHAECTRKIETP